MGIPINIKRGFSSYLEGLNELSTRKYVTNGSDASIFMYANEFKNYLSDEINVDADVLSMSINDILDMEVKNGKLVAPEEVEEDTQATEPSQELDSDAKITEENPEGTNVEEQVPVDAEVSEGVQASEDVLAGSNIQSYGEDPTVKMGEVSITDVLNGIMDIDNVKDVVDADLDGEISEEEVHNFLNAIKGYDGNGEDVSLEDILGALQAINKEEFSLDPEKAEEKELEVKEQKEAEQAQIANNAQGASGNSGVSGGGNWGGSGVSGNSQSQGVQEKTLDNMNKEELNAELNKAESDLSDKQNNLSAILDGSDSQIKGLEDNVEAAYETYQEELEKVDEDMADQLDTLKQQIDNKEKEIDEQEQKIADQEVVVSDCENAYNNAVSTRETLESSLEALNSVDTSDMDDSKKAELSSKKTELQGKIEDAKAAEKKAKEDWDNAKDTLKELNDEKTKLESSEEGQLGDLNKQMTDLEAEIAEKYPEIQEYMDAYNTAKKELTETKQTAISDAKKDIQESQNYVNDVKTAITNYDNKQTVKEYCFGDFGEEIADFAQQFIGCNEADGSANKFLGGASSSQIPWCAAFVEYVMENSGNYENVADWYKNIDNKWYCPNIYNAANAAGAIINGSEVQPGDIILFDWNGDGTKDHVGVVKSVENGKIITTEGNTSNQVANREYNINDGRLTFCKTAA